ncbi:MAG: type II toxin-antitoxin system PemK/MazF family toxin [Patescibacteria group bacterium]
MIIPERGDIILTDLGPTSGREQKGFRPCVVLSHLAFNQSIKMAYICAITSKIKGNSFEVNIDAAKTSGVGLAHQIKVIDLRSRKYSIVDKASNATLREILGRLKNIID